MKRHYSICFGIILFVLIHSNLSGQNIVTGSGPPDYHFLLNGEPFFPIGWYNVAKPMELQLVKNAGVTVVLNYWNIVWENYGPENKPYNKDQYVIALPEYLNSLNRLGLKAIIPLGMEQFGKFGFTTESIIDIVRKVKDHPSVFAWYLFDEPYSRSMLNNNQYPSSNFLKTMTDRIRRIDRSHPLIPVIVDSRFFPDYNNPNQTYKRKDGSEVKIPPPIDPSSYDAIGMDNYVYKIIMDNNTHPWNDYNNIARVTTIRCIEQVKKYNKMGFVFVAMAHDRFSGNRDLSMNDIKYQSLSPIIHGARGLLYYWWNEQETRPITRENVNRFIDFFSHFELDSVLLKGENVSEKIKINQFFINGQRKSLADYRWRNYNNGDPSVNPDFIQFNYIARRYKNSIYLFVVNDYKPTIEIEFDFRDFNQFILQVVELQMGRLQIPRYHFFLINSDQTGLLSDTFFRYDAKVYRIDLLK